MSDKLGREGILKAARRVLKIEEQSLAALRGRINSDFAHAVELLAQCRGRVVLAGMGKSGLVCRKIAATFASTGTPALFMHPAEGGHGDLGMLVKGDILIAVSNSGETEEMIRILPTVKRLGIPIISMTGNTSSSMAKRSDVVLDISVAEEACPLNLAPTASTTVTMALGDALAIALLEMKGFTEDDFALFHPGGALGRRLLTVEEIMHTGDAIPMVDPDTTMRDVLFSITSGALGFTCVVDESGCLKGIITDGDLRRLMERVDDPLHFKAGEVMTTDPFSIEASALAARALQIMETQSITSLVIPGDDGLLLGVIHMHDILRAGVA
jgi:arabinose-5-phosphate isomerase